MDAKKPIPKIKNQGLADHLSKMGLSVGMDTLDDDHYLAVRGKMSAVLRYCEQMRSEELKPHFKNETNFRTGVGHLTDADSYGYSGRGGSLEDLLRNYRGEIDMTPFYGKRDELRQTGFEKRIREKMAALVPRRKRTLSEHDGDWSFDRKWEMTPFDTTRKALGIGRCIKITANISSSGMVSAESINKFGALVWAVSDIVEACGIQTEVIARFAVNGITADRETGFLGEFTAKSHDTYVTPTTLAAMFHCLTYRRAVWCMESSLTDLIGKRANDRLGRPMHDAFPVKWVQGTGQLIMNVNSVTGDINQLEEEILASVRETVGSAA